MDGSPRRRAARGSAGLIARTRPPGTGPSAAARIVRRTALAVVLATALAAVAGEAVLRAMLPALSLSLQRLAPDFSLISLAVGIGAGMSLRADVTLPRAVVSGERVYWPDPRGRATASTIAGLTIAVAARLSKGRDRPSELTAA